MNDFRTYSAAFHAKNDDILHFGILGMKWGVRRYQNPDGSLTPAGQKRYNKLSKQLDDANDKYYEHWKKSYGSEDGKGSYSDRSKTLKYAQKTKKLMKETGRTDVESPADRLNKERKIDALGRELDSKLNDQVQAKKIIESDNFKKDKFGEYSKNIDGQEHTFAADDIEGAAKCYKDHKVFMNNKKDHETNIRSIYEQGLKNYRDEYIKWAKQAIKKGMIPPDSLEANTKYFNDMLSKMKSKPYGYTFLGNGQVFAFFDDGVDDLFGPRINYDIKKRTGSLAMDD